MSNISNDEYIGKTVDEIENKLHWDSECEENRIEPDHEKVTDLLSIKVDLSQEENLYSVESKVCQGPDHVDPRADDRGNSVRNEVISDQKGKDVIKPPGVEINNSLLQNIDACCNSEKASFILTKSEFVSEDFSTKNKFEINYKEAKPSEDLLNLGMDLSLNEVIHIVQSKVGEILDPPNDNRHNCDKSLINHNAASSDEKQKNFIKPLEGEVSNSCKQTSYEYCNSETGRIILNKSEFITSGDFSAEKVIESDYEKSKFDTLELISKEKNDVFNMKAVDLLQFKSMHRVESPVEEGVDFLNFSDFHLNVVNSDERKNNFTEVLDTEINKSCKQTVDECNNSDFISNKSDFKILVACSERDSIEFGHAEEEPGLHEISNEDEELDNEVEFLLNAIMHSSESKLGEGSKTVEQIEDSNSVVNELTVNRYAASKNRQNFIKPQDTKMNNTMKQTMGEYCNLEKGGFNSGIVDINLEGISMKDHSRPEKNDKYLDDAESELRKYQKNNGNESNCIINAGRDVCEEIEEIRSCLDTMKKNLNMTVKGNELNHDFTVGNSEESKTIYQMSSPLREGIQKGRMKVGERKQIFETTTLKSKNLTILGGSNVNFDSDKIEENSCCEVLNENFRCLNNRERNFNANVPSLEKFCEEFDSKLEILKVNYSGVERELVYATEKFRLDDVYAFFKKLQSALSGFQQSLQELRTRFKVKWLLARSPSNERIKQLRPRHQQYSEKTYQDSVDRGRFKSEHCTRVKENSCSYYEKVESHHRYERYYQLYPQETFKMAHKYRSIPKYFSSFEKKTSQNLYQEKRKSSPGSCYEPNFQQSPEKRSRICSEKCLSKNGFLYGKETVRNRLEEETKLGSNSNDLGYYTKTSSFSKSYAACKKISEAKMKSRTGYIGHSKRTSRSSSSDGKYKKLRTSGKYKISESRYKGEYKMRKYSSEEDFATDSSCSSQISGSLDSELSSIQSDPKYYQRTKHLNIAPKNTISVRKKVSSRNKRSRNAANRSEYEREIISLSGSDSDSSNSVQVISFGKKHPKAKGYVKNTNKESLNCLINRQMNCINENISRRDDAVKPVQNFSSASNYIKKYKLKSEEKLKGTIDTLEDKTSERNRRKRKKEFEQNATSCKVKSMNSISKNKRNTGSYEQKLQSVIMSSSLPNSVSFVGTKRRANEKRTRSSGDYKKERGETEFRSSDHKRSHEADAARGSGSEDDEQRFERELSAVTDMASYILFLGKKTGEFTNGQLLLQSPAEIIKEQKRKATNAAAPKPKYGATDYIRETRPENSSIQKSQYITKNNAAATENVAGKVKKTTHAHETTSKPSFNEKTAPKKPTEGKREVSSSLQSFMKLNQEIGKKKVAKRTTVKHK